MKCPLCRQKKNRQAHNMECCPDCAYYVGLIWAMWDRGEGVKPLLEKSDLHINTALSIASYAAQHYKRNR